MSGDSTWGARKPTRVRRALDHLKRWRYRVQYWKVLREFRQFNPRIAAFALSRADKRRIRDYWRGYGIRSINLDWYRLFGALLGKVDERMVPEELFRVELEHLINTECMAVAHSDKNVLARDFPDIHQPVTVMRNMNGRYFDSDYRPLTRGAAWDSLRSRTGSLLVKPAIDSGSGFNIHRIEVRDGQVVDDGEPLTLEFIERGFGGCNFLFQEFVSQHPALAAYHPKSLNTCRVITLRLEDEFHVIAGTFRMGRGKYVDNGHAGGLLCGIDAVGGLTPFAFDCELRRYGEHPLTGHPFTGQAIPHYDRMTELAVGMHRQLVYHNMVSFDIALDSEARPCLVEINLFGQGIEPHQLLQGRPIFGPFMDRVMDLAVRRREGR
jgi:hypothetical protein